MPGRKNFDAQLAALEELRELPVEACVAPLRAALKQQNNYIVAKAAALVEQHQVNELLPDLLVAFDRFFEDAEKRDPQCWAKNSLSRTLAALELQEPAPFLRGIKHVQLEAVWGRALRHRRHVARNMRAGPGAMPHGFGGGFAGLFTRCAGGQRQIGSWRCGARCGAGRFPNRFASAAIAGADRW